MTAAPGPDEAAAIAIALELMAADAARSPAPAPAPAWRIAGRNYESAERPRARPSYEGTARKKPAR
jgi:hypothetical protein